VVVVAAEELDELVEVGGAAEEELEEVDSGAAV